MDNLAKELALDQQIALAPKLAKLYRDSGGGAGDDTPMLPLPVCLFVDEALRLIRTGQSLNALPSRLPQIYSRYLEAVNP